MLLLYQRRFFILWAFLCLHWGAGTPASGQPFLQQCQVIEKLVNSNSAGNPVANLSMVQLPKANLFRLLKIRYGPTCSAIDQSLRRQQNLSISLTARDIEEKNTAIDLSPLASLNHFRSVSISAGAVDLSVLNKFYRLTHLYVAVRGGDFSQLGPLGRTLNTFKINDTQLSDLSFISHFTRLRELQLITAATDFSPLQSLTKLRTLTLENKNLDAPKINIKPLSRLINLESLAIINLLFKTITPLMPLGNLRTLSILNNPELSNIGAIRFIEGLTAFSYHCLDLTLIPNQRRVGKPCARSNFKTLNALTELNWLGRLSLGFTPNLDFQPIHQLRGLKTLKIFSSQLNNIAFVQSLLPLEHLDLSHNMIDNVEPLSALRHLQTLKLDQNQIKDLTPLGNLGKITSFSAQQNPVTSQKKASNCPFKAAAAPIRLFCQNPGDQ